jgi:PhzF family phenazine biosynthesis protein
MLDDEPDRLAPSRGGPQPEIRKGLMQNLIAIVDAFADAPFAGNPAAVCLLAQPRDAAWMQAFARETNLPATAFVSAGDDGYDLRWFSPTTELAICGHGTFASAHFLLTEGHAAPDAPVRFRTGVGELTCRREGEWLAMDFPAEPPLSVGVVPVELLQALGVEPRAVARNRFDYLVELDSADAVRAVSPDFALLKTVQTRGAIVTAASDTDGYDFVSRFFAPSAGVGEDSVTGSAHCALGPYWAARLGKDELVGYQASARGGTVRVRLNGDRVDLLGRGITIMRGTLTA